MAICWKSCRLGFPLVPSLLYVFFSRLVSGRGYGIGLFRCLIIAFSFTSTFNCLEHAYHIPVLDYEDDVGK